MDNEKSKLESTQLEQAEKEVNKISSHPPVMRCSHELQYNRFSMAKKCTKCGHAENYSIYDGFV